jgi:predicted TIM-barrel fold metal-dependent hydrolase
MDSKGAHAAVRGLHRREWLRTLAGVVASSSLTHAQTKPAVPISEYEPKSMLHVKESKVERAKFPVVDVHSHLSWGGREGKPRKNATPQEVLAVMDRKNLRTMINLTGGFGPGLEENIAVWQKAHPGRFLVFTEPQWQRVGEPGYAKMQADAIDQAAKAGARGIKVLKSLGLVVRDKGKLVTVDDARFDPMWEAAAAHKMPIAIHTSDPEAFFLPIDRFNERYEELNAHPDWSFHGKDYPSNKELQEARLRVIARHPKTQFICLHVADSEDLAWVSAALDKHPNMHVEIGARIGELGRQPRASRKFFDKYQDRIMFGTDAVPKGVETPQQIFGDQLYEIYFRFLETDDEYFDYAPAPKPPQGRWRIYGLALPDPILRKVYNQNIDRLLGNG